MMSTSDKSNGIPLSTVNLNKTGFRTLLILAWPVALSTLLSQLMTFVDALWVGRLGTVALAAVGVSGSVFGVMIALSQLVNAGTMAFVARYAGANDRLQAQAALFHGLLLALVFSLLLAIAGIPLSALLLRLFSSDQNVATLGTPYLIILFIILPLVFISGVSFIALQATGDTLSPLLVSLGSNVINLVLDPLLIFGWLGFPRLGIVGAGLATAIATLFNVAIVLFILGRRNLLKITLLRIRVFGQFLKVGFFAMLQGITRPLTGMVMFYIVALSGVAAQAAFTVGLRIIGILFIFVTGFSIATQSLVGQHLGNQNPKAARRVVRSSILAGMLIQVLISALLFVGARWLVGIFSPGNLEVIERGSSYLRILAPFVLLMPITMSWAGAQYGAGRTVGPALASVIANWLVKLPLAYLLSQIAGMDTNGVWLAIGVSVVVETAVNGIYYASGAWERSKLT